VRLSLLILAADQALIRSLTCSRVVDQQLLLTLPVMLMSERGHPWSQITTAEYVSTNKTIMHPE
jgi:hypothetical protein